MVILDKDKRRFVLGFLQNRLREPTIDRLISVPVFTQKGRPLVDLMAQRPKRAVREAVVITLSSFFVSQTRRSRYQGSSGGTPIRPFG